MDTERDEAHHEQHGDRKAVDMASEFDFHVAIGVPGDETADRLAKSFATLLLSRLDRKTPTGREADRSLSLATRLRRLFGFHFVGDCHLLPLLPLHAGDRRQHQARGDRQLADPPAALRKALSEEENDHESRTHQGGQYPDVCEHGRTQPFICATSERSMLRRFR